MLELPYSLVIEATEEPDYFGFHSPELEGFAGIGHSVEDCLDQAKWGMREHLELLAERSLPIPPWDDNPTVVIRNMPADSADPGVRGNSAAGGTGGLPSGAFTGRVAGVGTTPK